MRQHMKLIALTSLEAFRFFAANSCKHNTRLVRPFAKQPEKYDEGCYFDAYCGQPKTEMNPRGMSDCWVWWGRDNRIYSDEVLCPFGAPGEVLHVKNCTLPDDEGIGARLLKLEVIEITAIRAELLSDISESDVCAELGLSPITRDYKRPRFEALWDSINGEKAPWESNPFVWVLSFKRIDP